MVSDYSFSEDDFHWLLFAPLLSFADWLSGTGDKCPSINTLNGNCPEKEAMNGNDDGAGGDDHHHHLCHLLDRSFVRHHICYFCLDESTLSLI